MSVNAPVCGADGVIDVGPALEDLKRRSLQGSALSLLTQGCRWALNLGAMAVLARLLTPEDFGLVAMAYAVVSLAEMFTELGLTTATVQAPGITREQASLLFWMNLGLGILVAGGIAISSPAISLLYHEPRLTAVTLVLCGACPVTALGLQHRAMLTRQMRFAALASIDLGALTISLGVAVGMALLGLDHWALVARHHAFAAATCAGLWLVSGWRPLLPRRRTGARRMVAFGANLTAFDLVYGLARSMDKALLGWQWGTRLVGLYDKAYQLLLIPNYQINKPLSRVLIPVLSRLQHDPVRFRKCYRMGLLLVSSLGMPAIAFTFATADDLIPLVLGEKWVDSIPIFRVLAPAAFIGSFGAATDWVYAAMGQGSRKLRWGLIASLVTALGYVIGVGGGAIGMAAATSIVVCGVTAGPPALAYGCRGSPVGIGDVVVAVWRPAVASLMAALGMSLVAWFLRIESGRWLHLLANAGVFGAIYVLLWCGLPQGRQLVRELVQLMGHLRASRGSVDYTEPH